MLPKKRKRSRVPSLARTSTPGSARKKQKKGAIRPDKGLCEEDYKDFSLPLPIDSRVFAKWKVDEKIYACRILHRKQKDAHWEYYVHYNDLDRRNEVWLPREQIILEPDEDKIATVDHGSHIGGHAENLQQMKQFKKNLDSMVIGGNKIETWYWSPFPQEYDKYRVLHFCDYCLKFFGNPAELNRHIRICNLRHPPGNEIYRSKESFGTVAVFEIDGEKEWIYCQNVCYIAKLFLDHKTLLYDTNIFLFYIICEIHEDGAHFVGYFSKDKFSDNNNLACILTLPPYQKKGYGRFLISLSYALSKIEKRVGTPERPLSDLGAVSYKRYWARTLLDVMEKNNFEPLSLSNLQEITYISIDDIRKTFDELKLLHFVDGNYVLTLTKEKCDEIRGRKRSLKKVKLCDGTLIRWSPYETKAATPAHTGSLISA